MSHYYSLKFTIYFFRMLWEKHILLLTILRTILSELNCTLPQVLWSENNINDGGDSETNTGDNFSGGGG